MAISEHDIKELKKDRNFQAISLLLENFKQENNLDTKDILELMDEKEEELSIPVTAFSNKLGSLEVVVRYLKDYKKKTYHEIAVLLNRDDRTIWSSYNNSLKKQEGKLNVKEAEVNLPVSIFKDRRYSVLESIVVFLKNKEISFNKVAGLLSRNYQTIYTTYRRVKIKNEI